ncbi:MAG: MFS transporter [Clostridiales bacterium]|nr:MFS transporter [Clostridiales bacterium]
MKLTFKHTQLACYLAYISQAITTTFLPLLFVRLGVEFGFSLTKLTVLITITFFTEIFIDAVCPLFINKIGYRAGMVFANICAVMGTAGLAVFPFVFKNPYIGFIICDILYAVGGGFDEVLVSPIVEACPTKNKARAMGLLHSFYCWGCAAIVLFSTLFFRFAGIDNWRMLAILWAMIPLVNTFLFMFVPIRTIEEEKGSGKFSDMLKNPLFWLMLIVMICAGASELSMSQWASAFAETGLKVSKTMGDLLGPCAFAILMGLSRVIYSRIDDKTDISKILMIGAFVCIFGYLLASLSGNAIASLIGCAICGIAVAPMWPGAFSIASKEIPNASTAMFAAFALAGDLGCTAGPSIVGFVSGANDNIAKGLLCSVVFPAVMIVCLIFMQVINKKKRV